uniref:isoamylase n=1 Tax=Tetradesmus obliquus TaxID=3088 RepID=A0A383WPZ9_TETOB|eukprot:jgi/Sobl393_1/8943/SZX79353.1
MQQTPFSSRAHAPCRARPVACLSQRNAVQRSAHRVPLQAGSQAAYAFGPSNNAVPQSTAVPAAAGYLALQQQRQQQQTQRYVAMHSTAVMSSATSYTRISKGQAEPLGPSKQGNAVNFAVFSHAATAMSLVLHNPNDGSRQEITMNKSGDVWHVAVEGLPSSNVYYALRVSGNGGWETGYRWDKSRLLLDPRAPLVAGRRNWAQREEREEFKNEKGSMWWGTFDFDSKFDWGHDYERPQHKLRDLIIYEMTVRCFTASKSSGLGQNKRGTYLGVAEKASYLASLGVNAVELLPVFEYDELELQRWKNPRDHMVNVWGYSHMSFMAPMSRFGTPGCGPVQAAREFKEMVRTLHNAGIQVILDVVYNHTAELDDKHPYLLSMRGIDNATYYMVDPSQFVQLLNLSGCGNTVNANHPVVKQLIIDSLVRFVQEFHVDGFRFDLASCLCRDSKGQPMTAPPLIRDIAKHPILSKVHLIAEPWDLGMYQVGTFPNWDVWAEWNGKFRDDVRRFIKGDAGMKGAFATRMSGSADLYHNHDRRPFHSINFVTAHDGFSLYDMVSYNGKHNQANGEGNNDGTNDNFSWNCGHEGHTENSGVLDMRYKQMRNYLTALLMAIGTPMVVMGDEIAVTHHGNNNWYGHDTELSHMHWPSHKDDRRQGLLRFASELIKFRRSCKVLKRETFLGPRDITWHEDNWDNPDSRFLAWTLHDSKEGGAGDVYIAFNAHGFQVPAHLPKPPPGRKWARLIDTNLPSPRDFTIGGNAGVEPVYGVAPHSAIVLITKKI